MITSYRRETALQGG